MRRCLLLLVVLVATTMRSHAQCPGDYIAVSTSDLTSFSNLSTIDPVTKVPTNNRQASNGGVLRGFDTRLFVLGGAQIQIIDPCNSFHETSHFNVAPNYDQRDIYVTASNIAYVTRYGISTLGKVNLVGGATFNISLTALADPDGNPEMNQEFSYGGRLYICLERVDHTTLVPAATSYLAVFDLGTDAVIDVDPVTVGVQGIPLILNRPVSEINFRAKNGLLMAYFSAVGTVGVLDGGVIECRAGDPTQQTVLLTETNAGGDVFDAEIISDTKAYAIVRTPGSVYQLIAFNPATGLKVGATMFSILDDGSNFLVDIEPTSLGLLLSQWNIGNAGGVRCFDMATNTEIPGGPINVGLSPIDILVQHGASTAASSMPLATTIGQNYPNPFNPGTSIPFTLARAGRVTLRIYDVSGRLVATVLDEHRDAGSHVARWDGRRDDAGVVASGVYFARIEADGETNTRRMVLLK